MGGRVGGLGPVRVRGRGRAPRLRRPARLRTVGLLLFDELATTTEDAGIWTIQSGIFPENQSASGSTNAPDSESSEHESESAE